MEQQHSRPVWAIAGGSLAIALVVTGSAAQQSRPGDPEGAKIGLIATIERLERRVENLERQAAGEVQSLHLAAGGPVRVDTRWDSTSVKLDARTGDLLRVTVNFDAFAQIARGKPAGYYWSLQASGKVKAIANPGHQFQPEKEGGIHSQAGTSLFRAINGGIASFTVHLEGGDLSGAGSIMELVVIAENLGRR